MTSFRVVLWRSLVWLALMLTGRGLGETGALPDWLVTAFVAVQTAMAVVVVYTIWEWSETPSENPTGVVEG